MTKKILSNIGTFAILSFFIGLTLFHFQISEASIEQIIDIASSELR